MSTSTIHRLLPDREWLGGLSDDRFVYDQLRDLEARELETLKRQILRHSPDADGVLLMAAAQPSFVPSGIHEVSAGDFQAVWAAR